MHLSEDDYLELKKPFGILIPDKQVSKESIEQAIGEAGGVVSVGDASTKRLLSFGFRPDIVIIDGKERRLKSLLPIELGSRQFRCVNPAGTISDQAIQVIKRALAAMPSAIIVDGEEDLLALPVFVLAPIGFAVLYGQPLEGLVVVIVNQAKKDRAAELITKIRGTDAE